MFLLAITVELEVDCFRGVLVDAGLVEVKGVVDAVVVVKTTFFVESVVVGEAVVVAVVDRVFRLDTGSVVVGELVETIAGDDVVVTDGTFTVVVILIGLYVVGDDFVVDVIVCGAVN